MFSRCGAILIADYTLSFIGYANQSSKHNNLTNFELSLNGRIP
jgi:hypothetical protein